MGARGVSGPHADAPSDPAALDWIAVDWGTTRLRVWAMGADGAPLAHASSEAGMGGLDRAGFEPALRALVGGWLDGRGARGPVDAVACGMVGARQGWAEAPYRAVPCPPLGGEIGRAPASDPRLRVLIVPGLRQDAPADVMRGEETQVAGWLAATPGFDGVLCLPGTHSKWVRVSAGEVVGFRSFLTGELFALLAERSVLRHSVGRGGEPEDDAAFDAALAEAMDRPEALAARLFTLRAEDLLHGVAPGVARARLSGLLIGAELAAARGWRLGQRVAVIGAEPLASRYARALAAQGAAPERGDATALTLAGLHAARRLHRETTP